MNPHAGTGTGLQVVQQFCAIQAWYCDDCKQYPSAAQYPQLVLVSVQATLSLLATVRAPAAQPKHKAKELRQRESATMT